MLILDIEASGVNYDKHSVVSIGALDFLNPANRFYGEWRIWEGAHVMEDALEVNGYTETEITDPAKQSEAELIKAFIEWSGGLVNRTLVGQNVSFDRDMLHAAVGRAGLNWTFAHRTLDTHTMCWMHMIKADLAPPLDEKHKRSALNLDGILNYCGIPDEPEPHNALTGALSHGEVTSRLLYNKKLLPEFNEYEIPWL